MSRIARETACPCAASGSRRRLRPRATGSHRPDRRGARTSPRDELATRFGVSTVTIRKDLLALEADSRLVRTHGGAIALDRSRPELAFEVRDRLQPEEKGRIGAAAADLVQDGESIVMDASTTALYVARELKKRRGWTQLTVITNGLRLASELAGHPGITVLMLGGRVRWEALSVVGQLGDGLFSRINVQKAFLGAAGFTIETGLSDATDEEAQIKRSMVAAAREVIAIVDRTKWERSAFATFCATDQISIVLTDEGAPEAMVRALIDRGAQVRMIGSSPVGTQDRRRNGRGEGAAVTSEPEATVTAPRRAARDLEAVRGDPGARQRLARPPGRRGPRARRRKRRRQEHPGQDPRRRPPAGQRGDPPRRPANGPARSGPGPRVGDRRRPPGATPVPRPDGRRERLHRPCPGGRVRLIDWGQMRRTAALSLPSSA